MKIRVGFGFDVHQLVEGRELWLGGILLEHTKGLLGHSDADVLLHAVCDALLGAANMRDIGYHFPDTAGEFKNIDSKILLKKTVELIATKGYKVGNIDATICAERPKLKAHIPLRRRWQLLWGLIWMIFPLRRLLPRNSVLQVVKKVYRLMLLC